MKIETTNPVQGPDLTVGGDGPAAEPPVAAPRFDADTPPTPDAPPAPGTLWWMAGVLYSRKWFLIVGTALATAASVAVSLNLTPRYNAETRVMLPQGQGSSMLGMLDRVAPGASALLGQNSAGYTRYLTILTSRTVLERVVNRFNLEEVYETPDNQFGHEAAIALLAKRMTFDVAMDLDYLAIRVLDEDPERASAMANYFVEELNRENTRLTSSSAQENREFLERRVTEAQGALDSAQAAMQAFQEENGVVDIEQQGQAFYSALALLRGEAARLEVEYGALRQQYGDDNPQVQAAAAAVAGAQGQIDRALAGGDAILPVPTGMLPRLGRRYADLYQEVATQRAILEFILPLYEQARFDERREASAVQVLDPAIPPIRKAWPQRSRIVLSVALSAALLLAAYALARAWLRGNAGPLAGRLRTAAATPPSIAR